VARDLRISLVLPFLALAICLIAGPEAGDPHSS